MNIIKPPALQYGSTIGIFTPSFPAHVHFREKYVHGVEVLRSCGFNIVEGFLTAKQSEQGYRSAPPQERAAEFMELITDDNVDALMATIGGYNSSSMIPFLDFSVIRKYPKIVCGYSDVTSLHLAILKYAGVSTFYGPAVVPNFGEWPKVLDETKESFCHATMNTTDFPWVVQAPVLWSNHWRDAKTDEWKNTAREFQKNLGWRVLRPGTVRAPAVVANLNTLISAVGTDYFPDLSGKILILEEMTATLSGLERRLRHLQLLGVFDTLAALIFSKHETYDAEGAPFLFHDLIVEVLDGTKDFPVVLDFDCGHTHPMLTIAQMADVEVNASGHSHVTFTIHSPMVASVEKHRQ